MNLINRTKAQMRRRQAYTVLDNARYFYLWDRDFDKALLGVQLAFEILQKLEILYGKGLPEKPDSEQTTEGIVCEEIEVERDDDGYLIR